MIRPGFFVVLVLCWPCLGDDISLGPLQSSLIGMRGKAVGYGGPRGATPELTTTKHQLRDWVESHLAGFPRGGDEGMFQRTLNSQLRQVKLICCEDTQDQVDADWSLLGYLDELKLRRSGGFLILQTAVGIECGFDESSYIYSWSGKGWRRVWQTEQNTYTDKGYKPQTIHSVLISPFNRANDYLVLTLGSESWCASNLHNVYYRVFRLGPDPEARPLIDGAEWAFVADDPPIQGSVTASDALIEFTIIGHVDANNYQAVRHFTIGHDEVKRVDPLALGPRDFVSEWLLQDWIEASAWSESASRPSMLQWHAKLHQDGVSGLFLYPTMHCPNTPDLWQVGVNFKSRRSPTDVDPNATYFLVRWRPPYRFTMVQISDRPSPDCTARDPQADQPTRTLFPARN